MTSVCEQTNGFQHVGCILAFSRGDQGARAPTARLVWDSVARGASSAWNEGQEPTSLKIAQRLSCALHRENARAILRRVGERDDAAPLPGWDLAAEVPLV